MPYQDDDSYIADYDNDFGDDFLDLDDDEYAFLAEGDDYDEDADHSAFQNPVFGADFTDSDTEVEPENLDSLLDEFGF
jgi:hypothetical protein